MDPAQGNHGAAKAALLVESLVDSPATPSAQYFEHQLETISQHLERVCREPLPTRLPAPQALALSSAGAQSPTTPLGRTVLNSTPGPSSSAIPSLAISPVTPMTASTEAEGDLAVPQTANLLQKLDAARQLELRHAMQAALQKMDAKLTMVCESFRMTQRAFTTATEGLEKRVGTVADSVKRLETRFEQQAAYQSELELKVTSLKVHQESLEERLKAEQKFIEVLQMNAQQAERARQQDAAVFEQLRLQFEELRSRFEHSESHTTRRLDSIAERIEPIETEQKSLGKELRGVTESLHDELSQERANAEQRFVRLGAKMEGDAKRLQQQSASHAQLEQRVAGLDESLRLQLASRDEHVSQRLQEHHAELAQLRTDLVQIGGMQSAHQQACDRLDSELRTLNRRLLSALRLFSDAATVEVLGSARTSPRGSAPDTELLFGGQQSQQQPPQQHAVAPLNPEVYRQPPVVTFAPTHADERGGSGSPYAAVLAAAPIQPLLNEYQHQVYRVGSPLRQALPQQRSAPIPPQRSAPVVPDALEREQDAFLYNLRQMALS